MFSAAPRKPSSTGTASPTSPPTPTGRGSDGSAAVSSSQAATSSHAARTAFAGDSKTASASSPRSSTTRPFRASTTSRASSANRAASRAASASPRSRVKLVYPRTSAIRNASSPEARASSEGDAVVGRRSKSLTEPIVPPVASCFQDERPAGVLPAAGELPAEDRTEVAPAAPRSGLERIEKAVVRLLRVETIPLSPTPVWTSPRVASAATQGCPTS